MGQDVAFQYLLAICAHLTVTVTIAKPPGLRFFNYRFKYPLELCSYVNATV